MLLNPCPKVCVPKLSTTDVQHYSNRAACDMWLAYADDPEDKHLRYMQAGMMRHVFP